MRLGIDIGSTTIKLVLVDDHGQVVYSTYQRHHSLVIQSLKNELGKLTSVYQNISPTIALSGSLALDLAAEANLPFVQEVVACEKGIQKIHPEVDVVIEIGGEDQKILFLRPFLEFRMNGSCAGGTGAFIDQMAVLLGVTGDELDELAQRADAQYTIASRCGVFAKTDIQSLMNQGVSKANIAQSIFQAVAKQTVAGLAQGKTFKGKIALLGGPLTFQKSLVKAFETLFSDSAVSFSVPEHSEKFIALGAAQSLSGFDVDALPRLLGVLQEKSEQKWGVHKLQPLFVSKESYRDFLDQHKGKHIEKLPLELANGPIWYGIDAGSTTTKVVAIDGDNRIVFMDYHFNQGNLVDSVMKTLKDFYRALPPTAYLAGVGVTGYGEAFVKVAIEADFSDVETLAHYEAARFFEPDVDFIVDIGGQDIKCFTISEGQVDRIMINEACSSGCGSFISTFAQTLGYSVEDFAALALKSKGPYDLGTRCTVFMNSAVKQALRDQVKPEDIAAGISYSVVKNALYKVLNLSGQEALGRHIVVQGGTFENDSVLRAFEIETGRLVIRPTLARFMGAFGIARLTQRVKPRGETKAISREAIETFRYDTRHYRCGLCTNSCLITRCDFPNGRTFGSGNQCSRGATEKTEIEVPNAFDYKLSLLRGQEKPLRGYPKVGLPLVLNMYENLPFWVELFYALDFDPVFTKGSDRSTYEKGLSTIPSDTACYPAKLVHGHIIDLLEQKVDYLFYPCMTYNVKEKVHLKNRYNCPVVAYYPENIRNNMDQLGQTVYLNPYYDISQRSHFMHKLMQDFAQIGIHLDGKRVGKAYDRGYRAYMDFKNAIVSFGESVLDRAKQDKRPLIILGGRPYHCDPEVSNGLCDYIASLGAYTLTEDAVSGLGAYEKSKMLNQWTFHGRLFDSAVFAKELKDVQVGYVQLVSFGCGLDAITTYDTEAIFHLSGTPFTQIKIDEIKNLGSAKLRIRSLLSQMGRSK